MEMDDLEFPSYRVKVDRLQIHYKCSGTGSPVILLQGSANDWHEWQANFAFFAQNFRTYALDLPGFGLSESPNTLVSPRWFSSFLGDFMEALSIKEAHIIGHSLGGTITLAFALDFPERVKKVVIVDSGGLGKVNWKGQLLLSLARGMKKIAGREKNFRYKPGGSIEDWFLIDRLRKLKSPAMVIWGGKDPYLLLSQAKLACSLIPDCRLYICPGCHHAPHREWMDEFNKLVCQFLCN